MAQVEKRCHIFDEPQSKRMKLERGNSNSDDDAVDDVVAPSFAPPTPIIIPSFNPIPSIKQPLSSRRHSKLKSLLPSQPATTPTATTHQSSSLPVANPPCPIFSTVPSPCLSATSTFDSPASSPCSSSTTVVAAAAMSLFPAPIPMVSALPMTPAVECSDFRAMLESLDAHPDPLMSLLHPLPTSVEPPAHWTRCAACESLSAGLLDCTLQHVGRCVLDDDHRPACHVVPLDPIADADEYFRVAAGFPEEFFDIITIHRIQNPHMHERYTTTKHACRTAEEAREHNALYHLSRGSLDEVLAQGLDQRVGRGGMFGRGIYFSDDVFKANMYHRGAISETRIMFRASVLLGKTKEYEHGASDQSLCREPRGFNSVKGNVTGHDEFVVYENERVILDYMVEYRARPQTWEETLVRAWLNRFKHRNPTGVATPAMLDSIRKAIRVHPLLSAGLSAPASTAPPPAPPVVLRPIVASATDAAPLEERKQPLVG